MKARHLLVQITVATCLLSGLFGLSGSEGVRPASAAMAPVNAVGSSPVQATCSNDSCAGVDPGNAGCDGAGEVSNVGSTIWAPGVQGTIEIRHSTSCNARWARIYWINGATCDMSALQIQQRRSINGIWKNSAIQEASRGLPVFCTGGKYWTKMVPGQPGQVRVRYAEGYMAAGCVTGCVRWRWMPWSAWRG